MVSIVGRRREGIVARVRWRVGMRGVVVDWRKVGEGVDSYGIQHLRGQDLVQIWILRVDRWSQRNIVV